MSAEALEPAPTRPGIDRRDLIFGGAAAAAAALAYARTPRTREMKIAKNALDKIVPKQIGPWHEEAASGIVLPPPDQLSQLLYDQQFARVYVSDTRLAVMFLMAYGSSQDGVLQIHRPEICYPAGGYRLTDTVKSVLPTPGGGVPVRTFTASSMTRVEEVLYWTRIGDALPVSWAEQRLAVFRSNLAGLVPDGLLVRFSTVSQNHDQAVATLTEFARTLLAAIGPAGRAQLIGQP